MKLMRRFRGRLPFMALLCVIVCASAPVQGLATGFVFSPSQEGDTPPNAQTRQSPAPKETAGGGFIFSVQAEETLAPTQTPPPERTEEPPAPEPTQTQAPKRYGRTLVSGVNIRAEADAAGEPMFRIRNTGTFFIVLETVDGPRDTRWHLIELAQEDETIEGYVRADLVEVMTEIEYLQTITPVRVVSVDELAGQGIGDPQEDAAEPDTAGTEATPRPSGTPAPFVFRLPTP